MISHVGYKNQNRIKKNLSILISISQFLAQKKNKISIILDILHLCI